jgi:DNA-binding MarR family transcriptional regulator
MSSFKTFQVALHDWSEVFMRRSMREWMRYVRSTGLSMPQFNTLMKLYYGGGGCGLSEITSHLDVTAAAASQLVDGLVHKGLLERAEAEHDRRAKHITLTGKGRTLVERGIEARSGWTKDLTDRLSAERREAIAAALRALTEAARELEAEAPEPLARVAR